MRTKGLEPPRLTALDPKSSAATNYAMSAECGTLSGFCWSVCSLYARRNHNDSYTIGYNVSDANILFSFSIPKFRAYSVACGPQSSGQWHYLFRREDENIEDLEQQAVIHNTPGEGYFRIPCPNDILQLRVGI